MRWFFQHAFVIVIFTNVKLFLKNQKMENGVWLMGEVLEKDPITR
jgi:hypothetical protein